MSEEQPDNAPNLSDLITLKQAAELSGLSYSHLRLLARRGDIWAVRLGNSWFTTAEAVTAYASEVHNPGPKPGANKKSSSEDA
jgi:excisionase family DNA binding protein